MFRLFGNILVFLMMACAIMTIGMLIQNVLQAWHAGIISGVLLFIVIDRLYTYRQLKSLTPLSSEWSVAIGGQWLLILLVMRLLLSFSDGIEGFRTDLALFARGYLAELFTLEYVVSLILALLFWFLTGQFLDLLDEIGLDPQLALSEEPVPIQDTVPAHQRLVGLTFSIGIGLVILTALARVDIPTLVENVQGLPRIELNQLSGVEAGALFYFMFGLALLSLSRLMSLQTHWNRLRIPVSSRNLTRQWGIYSLVFLLSLAVIVSLLPSGDSLGFFSLLQTLMNFLITVLFFIAQLIIGLVMLLISLPFALFGGTLPNLLPAGPPPMVVLPPVDEAAPAPVSPAGALLRSILLWGALGLILLFSLLQFVRQHGGLRAALQKSRVMNWLALAWQWLNKNVGRSRESVTRLLADGLQSLRSRLEGSKILSPASFVRLRSLDPRQQIYFFYLAMIRRGDEQGVPRKPSQTPSEYAATLETSLPVAEEDIRSLTESFVEARYSRREVHSEDVDRVRETWGRIRRALRSKPSKSKSGDSNDSS